MHNLQFKHFWNRVFSAFMKPKVHHCTHKSLHWPIQFEMNPVHVFTISFFNRSIHFSITLMCVCIYIYIYIYIYIFKSREISVNTVTRLRAGPLGFDSRQGLDFSFHHQVWTGSGAHPATYPAGYRGLIPRRWSGWAWSWPLTSIYCPGEECVELQLHSPVRLHGAVLN
jgi:hypothetical protein